MLKEYIPINGNMMITIGEGIGAKYGANPENKRVYAADTDASFALKADIGFTYFIMERYGVGINVEYNASLAFGDGLSFSWGVTPALTFDMIF